ncbi:hypothetical protein F4819DRAFT_490117 [Hypoxylon fuscum]|nr:hypothetical protein F4819DRAFT_490117 [Hypoxylon fuscum]
MGPKKQTKKAAEKAGNDGPSTPVSTPVPVSTSFNVDTAVLQILEGGNVRETTMGEVEHTATPQDTTRIIRGLVGRLDNLSGKLDTLHGIVAQSPAQAPAPAPAMAAAPAMAMAPSRPLTLLQAPAPAPADAETPGNKGNKRGRQSSSGSEEAPAKKGRVTRDSGNVKFHCSLEGCSHRGSRAGHMKDHHREKHFSARCLHDGCDFVPQNRASEELHKHVLDKHLVIFVDAQKKFTFDGNTSTKAFTSKQSAIRRAFHQLYEESAEKNCQIPFVAAHECTPNPGDDCVLGHQTIAARPSSPKTPRNEGDDTQSDAEAQSGPPKPVLRSNRGKSVGQAKSVKLNDKVIEVEKDGKTSIKDVNDAPETQSKDSDEVESQGSAESVPMEVDTTQSKDAPKDVSNAPKTQSENVDDVQSQGSTESVTMQVDTAQSKEAPKVVDNAQSQGSPENASMGLDMVQSNDARNDVSKVSSKGYSKDVDMVQSEKTLNDVTETQSKELAKNEVSGGSSYKSGVHGSVTVDGQVTGTSGETNSIPDNGAVDSYGNQMMAGSDSHVMAMSGTHTTAGINQVDNLQNRTDTTGNVTMNTNEEVSYYPNFYPEPPPGAFGSFQVNPAANAIPDHFGDYSTGGAAGHASQDANNETDDGFGDVGGHCGAS